MPLNPHPCLGSTPSQDISSSQVLCVTIRILLPFDNPVTLVVLKQALHPLSGRGNLVTQLLPSSSLVSILYLSSWTSTSSSWTITLSLHSLSSTKREIVALSQKTVSVMLKQCSNVLHIILENVLMLFGSVQHQLLCCCYFNWNVGGGCADLQKWFPTWFQILPHRCWHRNYSTHSDPSQCHWGPSPSENYLTAWFCEFLKRALKYLSSHVWILSMPPYMIFSTQWKMAFLVKLLSGCSMFALPGLLCCVC